MEVGLSVNRPVPEVARIYFQLGNRLDFLWFRERVAALPRDNRWQALARSAAQEGAVLLKNAAPAPRGAASNCSDGHFLAGMDWGGVSTCYHRST